MNKEISTLISDTALKILRPLVRVMIRNGISCGSFEGLVRKAYVREAYAINKKNNQKITVSNISAQTGLSRKEVKRINELSDTNHENIEQRYNRAIRVISGWLHEPAFTDAAGKPKILALSSNNKNSFADLAKQFSGDIPAKTMLNLLIAANCVKVISGSDKNRKKDSIELIKHAYVPGNDSTEMIAILGTDTNELLNTIDHNLTAGNNDKRYQRKVSAAAISTDAIKEFKTISDIHSQVLLEHLNTWLSQNEASSDDEDARYVSVGIYYYEKDNEQDNEQE
jgi:hypothetical protein